MGRSGVLLWFRFDFCDDGGVECLSLCSSVIFRGSLTLYQYSVQQQTNLARRELNWVNGL